MVLPVFSGQELISLYRLLSYSTRPPWVPALDPGLHEQGRPVHLVVVGLAALLGQLVQQRRRLPTDLGRGAALAVGATGRDLLQQHHAGPRGSGSPWPRRRLRSSQLRLSLVALTVRTLKVATRRSVPFLARSVPSACGHHGLQVRVRLRDRLRPVLVHREQPVVEVVGRPERCARAGGLGGGHGVRPGLAPRSRTSWRCGRRSAASELLDLLNAVSPVSSRK